MTDTAWSNDFKGNAVYALFNLIVDLLSPKIETYARATCIINSSGTGKSRMVDQLSYDIITVPMCLRRRGSQGVTSLFPILRHINMDL